jgi:2-phospho-L-lactate/phosphoenolpyruvate guanylyltransferase
VSDILATAGAVVERIRRRWQDRPVSPTTGPRWTIVLPVQRAESGKTRLRAPAGTSHPSLARAIALDSLAAVRGCPDVGLRVVVTSDPVVADVAGLAGDLVVADPDLGLTGAVDAGIHRARAERPGAPLAVLLADVPAARPQDLSTALAACAEVDRAVLTDLDGIGTVLLAAGPGQALRHSFGPGSAQRHRRLGAQDLDLDLPRLRRDVDTAGALAEAGALGLGPATSALLAAGRPVPGPLVVAPRRR